MFTKQQILSAAGSLFARQGYDSTTITQIARQAGLTKGAVYYFFTNKAELFCAAMDEGIDYIQSRCQSLLQTRSTSCQIARDIISFYIDMAYDNVNLFLILFGSRSSDPQVQDLFSIRIHRLLSCFQEVIRAGISDGLLLPMDPGLLSRMLVGMIYGLLSLPQPPSRENAARAICLLLERGIYTAGKEADPL